MPRTRFLPAPLRRITNAFTVLAVLVVAAFVLNPSSEQHRRKIREAVADRSPIAGALGLGAAAAFVSTYHPLGLASYTTINGRTVSVGAFATVWVLTPSPAE
jgi:TRAP-type C4-dicarboxylate transport system permease small subunit